MALRLIPFTAGLMLAVTLLAQRQLPAAEPDATATGPDCELIEQPIPSGQGVPDELTIGYRIDAAPFSYRNEKGAPAGYSVGLCTAIAEALVGRDQVRYEATTAVTRFVDLAERRIDLLCDSSTLTWRQAACFDHTLLTFPSGPALAVAATHTGEAPASPMRVGVLAEPSSTAAKATAPGMDQAIAQALNAAAIELVYKQSYRDLFDALARPPGVEERLDAVFADREILLEQARRHPGEFTVREDLFQLRALHHLPEAQPRAPCPRQRDAGRHLRFTADSQAAHGQLPAAGRDRRPAHQAAANPGGVNAVPGRDAPAGGGGGAVVASAEGVSIRDLGTVQKLLQHSPISQPNGPHSEPYRLPWLA